MLALMKSHYSIGKSILTLDHPDTVDPQGPQSVFSIAKNSSKIVLVEDTLIGFLQAQKTASALNKQLIFGLRISCSHTNESSSTNCDHKIIIFARNDDGCKLLNKIYSKAFCEYEGVIPLNVLKNFWNEENLYLAVPFYDSFIFMNNMHFCSCIPDFSFCNPIFLVEDNQLPFDNFIKSKVVEYCENFNYQFIDAKSVYYEKRSDFSAYQTYKSICAKKNGKQRTLSVPNFDHLASPEFCYESYLNHESA